jgi:hypothetical protein
MRLGFDRPESVHAPALAEPQIQQNDIHAPLRQPGQSGLEAWDRLQFKSDSGGLVQLQAQELNVIGVVLDEQYSDRFNFHVRRGPPRINLLLPSRGKGVKFLFTATAASGRIL